MPVFEVRFLSAARQDTTRRVEAVDLSAVAAALGIDPLQVLSARPVSAANAGSLRLDVRLFSQELAVLLDAGIPLLEAMQTLAEKESRPSAVQMFTAVLDDLKSGLALSEALARHPLVFDGTLRALVAANERTGQLAASLRRHAAWLAWVSQLRGRVAAALAYPTLLLLVGGSVILFLLVFVLPRFAGLFDGMGQQVPWGTRVLMQIGQFIAAHATLSLALGAALAAGAWLAWRSGRARTAVLAWLWRMPWIGEQLRRVALARLYRGMSLLLTAGVPALQTMLVVTDGAPGALRLPLQCALARIKRGERLSDALESENLLTAVARRMLRVGENSGTVPDMLERAATFHDEELARLSDFITRILNPVLMLVMGVVIGGIIVLMYLPIFQLVDLAQ